MGDHLCDRAEEHRRCLDPHLTPADTLREPLLQEHVQDVTEL
jgi:hypothetical protein